MINYSKFLWDKYEDPDEELAVALSCFDEIDYRNSAFYRK